MYVFFIKNHMILYSVENFVNSFVNRTSVIHSSYLKSRSIRMGPSSSNCFSVIHELRTHEVNVPYDNGLQLLKPMFV